MKTMIKYCTNIIQYMQSDQYNILHHSQFTLRT